MKNKVMRKKVIIGILIAFIGLLSLSKVYSFQVPALPNDNLVTNPWFRSPSDPNKSGLYGWTDADGLDKYWSSSQKEGNPSPDVLISGVCDFTPVYCGTAARLSLTRGESGGIGLPDVHAYLYQIIPADSSHRKLKFFTHWVSHKINPAEITIYGSNTVNGPWTPLWTPLYHQQDSNPPPPPGGSADLWTTTDFLTYTVNNGYNYYKIEIHARLPQGLGVGFKVTGVYFSTEPDGLPPTGTPPPATPTPVTPVPTVTTPPPTSNKTVYLPIIQSGK